MLVNAHIPVLGFAAWSGTGKTTLLQQLLPRLKTAGLRVGMLKHAHHNFDVDQPGKDSYALRKAGAEQMLIASSRRWALMVDLPEAHEPTLDELLGRLDQTELDLVLVEGFKRESFAKIELHRQDVGKPLLYPEDPHIIAVASDIPDLPSKGLPTLDINDLDAIEAFVTQYVREGLPDKATT